MAGGGIPSSEAFGTPRIVRSANELWLKSGYLAAYERFRSALDATADADATFGPLFEALNWFASLEEQYRKRGIALSDGQLISALRYARNRVHHQWADALEVRMWDVQSTAAAPIALSGLTHEWYWRRVAALPEAPETRISTGKAEYEQQLAQKTGAGCTGAVRTNCERRARLGAVRQPKWPSRQTRTPTVPASFDLGAPSSSPIASCAITGQLAPHAQTFIHIEEEAAWGCQALALVSRFCSQTPPDLRPFAPRSGCGRSSRTGAGSVGVSTAPTAPTVGRHLAEAVRDMPGSRFTSRVALAVVSRRGGASIYGSDPDSIPVEAVIRDALAADPSQFQGFQSCGKLRIRSPISLLKSH